MEHTTRLYLVGLLGGTYAISEISQSVPFGPLWLRWHLSSFGFPLSTAAAIVLLSELFGKRGFKSVKAALLLSTTSAIAVEIFQGFSGHFDIVDFALSIIACIIGFLIMGNTEQLDITKLSYKIEEN